MWIIYTLLAISFQTIRNIEQKKLSKSIDNLTASWSRFILPFPIAIIAIFLNLDYFYDYEFAKHIIVNAFFQMLGSIFLIKALHYRNYSIGVTLSKTETLQACVVGFLIFNNNIRYIEILSIIICFCGILLISNINFRNYITLYSQFKTPAISYGLLCGTCFALTAFNLKEASIILINQGNSNFNSAILVLLFTIFFQNIFFILIKIYNKNLKKSLEKLCASENILHFFTASLTSFIASFFWYSAYTIGKVIHVKIVAQGEIIIALLTSIYFLKEKYSLRELIGIFMILFGILIIILF